MLVFAGDWRIDDTGNMSAASEDESDWSFE